MEFKKGSCKTAHPVKENAWLREAIEIHRIIFTLVSLFFVVKRNQSYSTQQELLGLSDQAKYAVRREDLITLC